MICDIFSAVFLLLCISFKYFPIVQSDDHCNAWEYSEAIMQQDSDYLEAFNNEQILAEKFDHNMIETNNHDYRLYSDSGTRRLLDPDELNIGVPIIKIPIVWHIFYKNSAQNLQQAQLNSQIRVLNEDYRAANAAIEGDTIDSLWATRVADARVKFYQASVIRIDKSADASFVCDDSVKRSITGGSDAWDQHTYLNVWICDISGGILGYATFPCLLDTSSEWQDGVVLNIHTVGSEDDDINNDFYWSAFLTEYRKGRTLTHEIGHYLNLRHPWGNSVGCNVDDLVSDTPETYGPNFDCPTSNLPDSCEAIDPEYGIDLRDMFENFMDYSFDECLDIFTEKQAWRMRATLGPHGCRSEMYYNGLCYDCDNELGICDHSPCLYSEAGDCKVYNSGTGCSQCNDGSWKKDFNHACLDCQDVFGDGCLHCQDYNGCAQCATGYNRKYLADCGIYYCVPVGSNADCVEDDIRDHVANNGCILPCNDDLSVCTCDQICHCTSNTCHSNGCDQCQSGYFKKGYNYPCVQCQEYFGDQCLHCQDFTGCAQCAEGCSRVWNAVCGLYECKCNNICNNNDASIYCCKDQSCSIPIQWTNDGWCDCPLCEDESNYNCNSCQPSSIEEGCAEPGTCTSVYCA